MHERNSLGVDRILNASDAQGGRFDVPFWLSAAHLPLLLASLALFTTLGTLGWLARRAFAGA
jgi:hypothetical protein